MIAETTALDRWGYLVGVAMLLIIWAVLYALRRDLHSRMLTMSVLLVPLAPLGQYYFLKDYWRPPLLWPIRIMGNTYGGLADLLFAFAMGGLATAIYPVLARRYPSPGSYTRRRWLAGAFVFVEGASVITLTEWFHMNSIFSSSIGFVITAALVVSVRRDLWSSAVVSGVLSGVALAGAEVVLSFVVPLYLGRYWLLYHSAWGILIFGRVPLTEAIWGATFGAVAGPLYDAVNGFALEPRHERQPRATHGSVETRAAPRLRRE